MDKVCEILVSIDLNVSEEDTAWEAAMLWLRHRPERKESFQKVSVFTPSNTMEKFKVLIVLLGKYKCTARSHRNYYTMHGMKIANLACMHVLAQYFRAYSRGISVHIHGFHAQLLSPYPNPNPKLNRKQGST